MVALLALLPQYPQLRSPLFFPAGLGSVTYLILCRLFQLALRALLVALMVFAPILPAYELLAYLFFGGTNFWWSRGYSAPVAVPLAIFLVSGE